MEYCKVGICDWLMPISGPSAFPMAKAVGANGVQILDLGGAESNFPLTHPKVQDAYKKAAAEAKIEIRTLQLMQMCHAGKMKGAPGTSKYEEAILAIKKGIEACKAIGISELMLENFKDSWIYNSYELECTGMVLKEAGKLAQEAGVQLIYESFLPVDKTMLLYEISEKAFKLGYDTLNPLKYGFGDPIDELKRYPVEMIGFIHFKDIRSDFSCSALMGDGVGRYHEAVECLKQAGYSGWMFTENYYCVGEFAQSNDPFELMRADITRIKESFSN